MKLMTSLNVSQISADKRATTATVSRKNATVQCSSGVTERRKHTSAEMLSPAAGSTPQAARLEHQLDDQLLTATLVSIRTSITKPASVTGFTSPRLLTPDRPESYS